MSVSVAAAAAGPGSAAAPRPLGIGFRGLAPRGGGSGRDHCEQPMGPGRAQAGRSGAGAGGWDRREQSSAISASQGRPYAPCSLSGLLILLLLPPPTEVTFFPRRVPLPGPQFVLSKRGHKSLPSYSWENSSCSAEASRPQIKCKATLDDTSCSLWLRLSFPLLWNGGR